MAFPSDILVITWLAASVFEPADHKWAARRQIKE